MQAGQPVRTYRTGYEGYGQLIQRLAQSDHQSCLLLTGRERPKGFARLARDLPKVRSLQLQGLPDEAAQRLLAHQGLNKNEAQTRPLIQRYSGHPLALKLVAETIDDLYFGDVEAFLTEDALIFADIGEVLDQQFARLSPLEQELMIWLAIEREPVSVQVLSDNLLGPVTQREFLEALRALQGRSLLEKQNDGFGLQNVVMEYTTGRFINQVCQELSNDIIETFNRHAFLKAQTKEYVRLSQTRLILQPVADRLLAHLGKAGLEVQFKEMLAALREAGQPGYAGGNILNLLLYLEFEISHFDFSNLAVWQAYLQGLAVQEVDFSHADLTGASFMDTFGAIASVAFSPTGQIFAAGTDEGRIRLWRARDRQPLLMLAGHTSRVGSIAFSPDGQTLVSGSDEH
jgi:hypothetical protein